MRKPDRTTSASRLRSWTMTDAAGRRLEHDELVHLLIKTFKESDFVRELANQGIAELSWRREAGKTYPVVEVKSPAFPTRMFHVRRDAFKYAECYGANIIVTLGPDPGAPIPLPVRTIHLLFLKSFNIQDL